MTAFDRLDRDREKGWHIRADQAPIVFSQHAVERFGERLRPGLPLEEVERQLRQILRASTISFEPPPWYADPERTAWGYLLIADFVMPLVRHGDELTATTLMAPGMLGREKRQRRNDTGAARRARRTAGRAAWVGGKRRSKDAPLRRPDGEADDGDGA